MSTPSLVGLTSHPRADFSYPYVNLLILYYIIIPERRLVFISIRDKGVYSLRMYLELHKFLKIYPDVFSPPRLPSFILDFYLISYIVAPVLKGNQNLESKQKLIIRQFINFETEPLRS